MAEDSKDPLAPALRICLAASGGGHVRQLLDLEPVWSKYDHFFVTEETALGLSIGQTHRHYFIPHFAIGQLRLGALRTFLVAAIRNFWLSARIIVRERPDIVLTTGAGAIWFTLLWARLFGARCLVIETFARFEKPSLFARWASPLAHQMILQSQLLKRYWPEARVFDPLRELDEPRPPKAPLLFATVGATLPFDRLVNSVLTLKAQGIITHEVIIQAGAPRAPVPGVEIRESFSQDEIQEVLRRADIVVCHGGTGSLITALREGCHVISMPRLLQLREHYDNHQAEVSQALAARGMIAVVETTEELAQALLDIGSKVPKMATTDHSELIVYLDAWLEGARGMARGMSKLSDTTGPAKLRVCLAGSGGGHIRQLLDLDGAWAQHDYFFLSEDTALSRSIAQTHPMAYVPHFALGQARLGSPIAMVRSAIQNFFASGRVIRQRRPQVLITTGAGAVFFALVWARLWGAKTIVIESFARVSRPSVFGRLSTAFAQHRIVQSKGLTRYWPNAAVFDPLKLLTTPRPAKQALLFATVGAILPFDRLIEMVATANAQGAIPEKILLQTGKGGCKVDGIDSVETFSYEAMQATLKAADIVVCHGGTGSLVTAMRQGCRVIAVPRLFALGEVYDDHQSEIVGALAARGMISVANTPEELISALRTVRDQPPVMATSDPAELVEYLNGLMADWAPIAN